MPSLTSTDPLGSLGLQTRKGVPFLQRRAWTLITRIGLSTFNRATASRLTFTAKTPRVRPVRPGRRLRSCSLSVSLRLDSLLEPQTDGLHHRHIAGITRIETGEPVERLTLRPRGPTPNGHHNPHPG